MKLASNKHMTLNNPVLMDNSRLRELNPNIALHFQASYDELSAYPKVENLIIDTKYVEWVVCPSCGQNDTHQLLIKWGIQYDQCPTCTHIFAKNRFKQEILERLYKDSVSDELDRVVNRYSFNQKYWSKVYTKYLSFIETQFGMPTKLLDVGCGTGSFIEACVDRGQKNCYGLDVYDQLVDTLSQIIPQNHIYSVNSFYDANLPLDFEVITMWGVLEHLTNPIEALQKAQECIKDGGLIIALVPNLNSRAFKILGVNTPTLNPRQHISFPTRQSMEYMCQKLGLKITDVVNELPVIDLMHNYIKYSDELALQISEKDESYYHVYIITKT